MCGRFAFYSPAEATAALFGVAGELPETVPRFNIAPTQDIAAIRNDSAGRREFVLLRWGLVPFWAKDASIGNRMINARSETAAEKPAYRAAFKYRRCIVPADGFYEWRRVGDTKTPYFISLSSGEPFALAGLWERWVDKSTGEELQSAVLLTTAADAFMSQLHDRMPVILNPASADDWISGGDAALTESYSPAPLKAWPVRRQVNNARNESSDLIEAEGDTLWG